MADIAGDVLDVQNVSVRRNGKNILDSLSWGVNEGERWVVLGPNGAGKTTLIQLVSGRLYPTQGQVWIVGEQIGRTNLADLRPLVGLASSALDQGMPDQSAFDVVRTAAYGTMARWRESYDPEDDARALALMDQMGVKDLAERSFSTLSTGERKRLGIARALMPNPEILLLDEPTSGLDLGGRESLLRTLTDLVNGIYAPVTVLVTHHIEEIPEGMTHALLLKNGTHFASGLIDDVLTSETVSALFDLPVQVRNEGGRYSARAL